MSVNPTGAIGYEAKTDPKGRVTVTYNGKTTVYKNYNEFVELFKKPYDAKHPKVDDPKGTKVQPNPNDRQLTDEEKKAREKARKAELAEIENAKKQVKANGVTTADGDITSHGNGSYTFDIHVSRQRREKITKDDERARLARYYDEANGEWIELGEKYPTMKDVRQALKKKEEEIKNLRDGYEKETKKLTQEWKDGQKKLADARRALAKGEITQAELDKLQAEQNALRERRDQARSNFSDARLEYQEVHVAHRASKRTNAIKNTGVGSDKRAFNDNVDAHNRLLDTRVFYDKADLEAAKKSPESKNLNLNLVTAEDQNVIYELVALGKKYYNKSDSSPQEKAIWGELANLMKDKNGKDIPLEQVPLEKIQDALIDITGGDMRLNYTEQQILEQETGLSMSNIRSAFKAYGFEAPNPLGKRVVNGLKEAAPIVATMGLSYLLTRTKAGAEATSTAEGHADATSTSTVTVTESGSVTATAHAEASVPGYKFDWTDPVTGEEIHKRISGQFAEDTQSVTQYYEAIATATAEASAHADAFATATAACEAVATLSPAALIAAPALAFLAGFAKKPTEISAAVQGANNDKLSKFVKMYKGRKNENIGNQIIQMAGQITGDKAVDRALIVAVLDHDIGSQNTVPTTRELRNALAHLDAIKAEVDKFKHLPPAPEPSVSPEPTVGPSPSPTPTEYCYDTQEGAVKKPNTHVVAKGDTVDMIIKAKYPDSDFRKAKAEFLKANPDLKDPNSIQIGQEFVLPDVDGKAPKMDGVVRQARGKRIIFRPSKMPGVRGEQTYDVIDCSDPNNKKVVKRGLTKSEAEAERDRLAQSAQQKKVK